jgi:hypothetical protein
LWILGFSSLGLAKNLARFGMSTRSKPKRRLQEVYKYPGFRPRARIGEAAGDPATLIVTLDRRSKKRSAAVAAEPGEAGTTAACGRCGTWAAVAIEFCWSWKSAVSIADAAMV